MSRIDTATARNLLMLKAPEFAPLRGWLTQVYHKAQDDMVEVSDETQLRRLQGRAKLAKELLEAVETSDTLLGKLAGRPQR